MCLLMQYKFSFLTASLNCGKAVSESEIEPNPLQWKHRVLNAGLPRIPILQSNH